MRWPEDPPRCAQSMKQTKCPNDKRTGHYDESSQFRNLLQQQDRQAHTCDTSRGKISPPTKTYHDPSTDGISTRTHCHVQGRGEATSVGICFKQLLFGWSDVCSMKTTSSRCVTRDTPSTLSQTSSLLLCYLESYHTVQDTVDIRETSVVSTSQTQVNPQTHQDTAFGCSWEIDHASGPTCLLHISGRKSENTVFLEAP